MIGDERAPEDQSRCVTPGKQHQAHLAGLKRLSARASAGPVTPPGTRRVVFSFAAYARSVIEKLQKCKVAIAEGLAEEDFARIEATYGFVFPPDLRGLLQTGVPVGAGFPNWRAGDSEHLRMRVNLPAVGLLHEVASGNFWWKAWGPRPTDLKRAIRYARCALRSSPILVPLYGHCYLPSSPSLAGNPVFFVYRKKVVYYGYDVADFLDRGAFLSQRFEFGDLMYDIGSFRNEKSTGELHHEDADSFHRASSSSSGSRSSTGEGESWGRSLDVLAQNTGFLVSPRSGGFGRLNSRLSFDGRSHEPDFDDIMKYSCIVEKLLPSQTLVHASMVPEDSRTPRRIEFWSDLAERVQKEVANAQGEGLLSPRRLVKKHAEEKYLQDRHGACKSSRWLNGYLGELSLILRQGGWREDDINDMIDSKSSSRHWNQQLDGEGVLVSLAREVELLSTSLKKAGWSAPDVTETMKMEPSALV